MFAGSHWGADHFAATHFFGGGISSDTGLVVSSWTRTRSGRKEPLAGYSLDYWVIDANDELVESGSGTTDPSGRLIFYIAQRYSGEDVLVAVNNLASDMETAGKINGQQVVTVQ